MYTEGQEVLTRCTIASGSKKLGTYTERVEWVEGVYVRTQRSGKLCCQLGSSVGHFKPEDVRPVSAAIPLWAVAPESDSTPDVDATITVRATDPLRSLYLAKMKDHLTFLTGLGDVPPDEDTLSQGLARGIALLEAL